MRTPRIAALAIIACLVGTAAASAPDTLWVRRLDMGSDEYGNSIASRGSAIAVVGDAWVASSNDLLVVRMNQDGDTIWTRTYDAGGDDQAISVCLDSKSNVLLAGQSHSYKGAREPGQRRLPFFGLVRNTLPAKQQQLALTAKYDSLGELKWLRTDTSHLAFGIAADTAGNCYVSGAHVVNDTSFDLWLAKLDSSGDPIWTRTFDFAPVEVGYRLAIDASGNIAACAYVGDFVNFDCLTLKLAPDGDTIWTRRYDRGPDDACCGVAIDPSGDIIVAGRTAKDTLGNALVLKYGSSGTLVWDKVYDFNPDDGVVGAACDSAGDIFVAGYTGASYMYDCLTMKLDSMGDTLWTATYGGSGDDEAPDVACDPFGNPIIAGYVTDSITSGVELLTAKYSALTGIAESPRSDPGLVRTHSAITAAPDFVISVPGPGRYDIRLCDLSGRAKQQVFSGRLSKGAHRFTLAGEPAGIYFVRVAAPDGGVSGQRLVVVK